jgi:hypothetical protein
LKSACTYLGNGVVILSRGCLDMSVDTAVRGTRISV